MAQKFMTYDQQLNKLQADKGLTISDVNFARKSLEEISYYSLIGGYKGLFLHPASKNINTALLLKKLFHFIILMNNSEHFS